MFQAAVAGDEAGLAQSAFVTLGPTASWRTQDGLMVGGEVAWLPFPDSQRRKFDGSNWSGPTSPRLFLYSVDLGAAASPTTGSATLWSELQVYNRSRDLNGLFVWGLSAGPQVAHRDASWHVGGQITAWVGYGLVGFVRVQADSQPRGALEAGAMLKLPIPLL